MTQRPIASHRPTLRKYPDPVQGSPAQPQPTPSPRESDEPRPCRQCGYNLEGQKPLNNIITCPECGRAGTWREVLRDLDRAAGWGRRLLVMSGPCVLCLVLSAAAAIYNRHTSSNWPHEVALIFLAVGFFFGLFLPPFIAANATEREPDAGVKFWIFTGGLAAGWGMNICSAILLWLLVLALAG